MQRISPILAPAAVLPPLRSVRPLLALWTGAVVVCLGANGIGAFLFITSYSGVKGSILAPEHEKWVMLAGWVIPVLGALAVAALVLGARRRGPAALMSISLLLICATELAGSRSWSSLGVPLPLFYIISETGWAGITFTFMTFPNGVFGLPWIRRAAFVVAAAHLSIVAYETVLPSLHAPVAAHYAPAFAQSALLLLAAAVLASRRAETADLKERRQIHAGLTTLLVAVLLFVGFAATNLGALLFLNGDIQRTTMRFAAWLLTSGYAVLSVGFVVAVLRHGLYDAETLLSRSTAFALLTLFWAALFAVVDVALKSMTSGGGAVISVLVAAAIIVPLKNAVTKWTDRRFRAPLTQLRERLPASMAELRGIATLPELLAEAVALIDAALKPECIAVVVDGKTEASRHAIDEDIARWRDNPQAIDGSFALRVSLRVSAVSEIEPLGWLLVGRRRDGTPYAADEQAALAESAVPIARAIRSVQLRERSEATRSEADGPGRRGAGRKRPPDPSSTELRTART